MSDKIRYRPYSFRDIWMGRIFLPTNQEINPLLDFGAVFSFLGDIWGIQINERFFWCSAPYFVYPYFGKCFFKINVENRVFPDKCERCGNYYDWTGIK